MCAIDIFETYKVAGPDETIPALFAELSVLAASEYIPAIWRRARIVYSNPAEISGKPPVIQNYNPFTISVEPGRKTYWYGHLGIVLIKQPLNLQQHADQTGKSCETAPHQLVNSINSISWHWKSIWASSFNAVTSVLARRGTYEKNMKVSFPKISLQGEYCPLCCGTL